DTRQERIHARLNQDDDTDGKRGRPKPARFLADGGMARKGGEDDGDDADDHDDQGADSTRCLESPRVRGDIFPGAFLGERMGDRLRRLIRIGRGYLDLHLPEAVQAEFAAVVLKGISGTTGKLDLLFADFRFVWH